jgi:hypothetical protein
VLALKKPTVTVLFNGGQLAVPLAKQASPAVLEVSSQAICRSL